MAEKAKRAYSVLIVDDDKFLLDMYTLKFKDCGCNVEALSDPVKALDRLRTGEPPGIVLLDIVMPTMSGFEFLETVRKEGLAKNASVIMLSNQGQQEDIDKATKLGAHGYIIKASAIPSEVCDKVIEFSKK